MAPRCYSPISTSSKYWYENVQVNCSDMKSLRGLLSTEKLIKPSQLSNPPLAAKAWGSERGRKPGRLERPPGPPDTSRPCLPGLPPISVCLGDHLHSQDILTMLRHTLCGPHLLE